MKELYEKPEIELIDFQPKDQLTGSGNLGGDDDVVGEGSIEEW